MSIFPSAAAAAVTPAVQSWSDAQTSTANVSTPEFPGPIVSDHAGTGIDPNVPPGGPSGPPAGTSDTVAWFAHVPNFADVPGDPDQNIGAIIAIDGHQAPMADFDSSAPVPSDGQGPNQMGSGPIAPDIHSYDTGGDRRVHHVIKANPGPGWSRRTETGQTYNSQGPQNTDTSGWNVSAPNDRQDLDQYQTHDADASDPRWIPYSERPVLLNIAHEPVPFGTENTGAYAPGGQLGATGPLFWSDESTVYTSPDDPVAAPAPVTAATSASVGFWGS